MEKRRHKPRYKAAIAMLVALAMVLPMGMGTSFAAEQEAANTVYKNGVIYTVEGENWETAPQESIAVGADGKILFVGSNEAAEAYIGEGTKVVDLNKMAVLPGFGDGHVHPPGTALTELYEIYLYESITKEQTLADIKAFIDDNPDQEVYWGRGYTMGIGGDESEGKGPKKEWLDAICSDKAIILQSNDGHNMWLNSKAFELNGITKDTTHPTGTVQKDPATGELWGTLTDAFSLVTMARSYTEEQTKTGLELFQQKMLAWGYTNMNSFPHQTTSAIRIMKELEEAGEWHMWNNMSINFRTDASFHGDLTAYREMRELTKDCKLNKVTTGKFFMDGVVEGMTAYLSEDYAEIPGFKSVPLWDWNEMKVRFDELMQEGIQIHVHSVGDQATTETIDALAYAQGQNPDVDARSTLTHIQVVKDSDKARMGQLGIIGAAQPFWHLKEPEWFDYVDLVSLGEERAWEEYPVKSILDAGGVVTFSGDHPVSPINNPFWAIEASVTRNLNNAEYYGVPDITDMDDPTWLLNPAERVSVKQAIECYTKNMAYQLFKEGEIGTLKVGKYADMIVIDQDLFKINATNIDKTKVFATIFNGEIVYQQKDWQEPPGDGDDRKTMSSGGSSGTESTKPSEPTKPDTSPSSVFSDIGNHWAKDAILFTYNNGMFSGTSANQFSPNASMTRGMIVTVLGRYAEVNAANYPGARFTDVYVNQYYAPYVEWAFAQGIAAGIGNAQFAPGSAVTREQMAKLLAGFIEKQGLMLKATNSAVSFTDESSISSWALDSVKLMQQYGIITGRPDGSFDPQGYITRAEAASMLMRMIQGAQQ